MPDHSVTSRLISQTFSHLPHRIFTAILHTKEQSKGPRLLLFRPEFQLQSCHSLTKSLEFSEISFPHLKNREQCWAGFIHSSQQESRAWCWPVFDQSPGGSCNEEYGSSLCPGGHKQIESITYCDGDWKQQMPSLGNWWSLNKGNRYD